MSRYNEEHGITTIDCEVSFAVTGSTDYGTINVPTANVKKKT